MSFVDTGAIVWLLCGWQLYIQITAVLLHMEQHWYCRCGGLTVGVKQDIIIIYYYRPLLLRYSVYSVNEYIRVYSLLTSCIDLHVSLAEQHHHW